MTSQFATHEVTNQSPPLEDINLFTGDRALLEAVNREGAAHAAKRLTAFGAICGSAEAFQRGRLANENPPRLKPFDSKGRRLDTVEFHPAYHELMDVSVREGLHCSAWDHLAKPGAEPLPGANVARSDAPRSASQRRSVDAPFNFRVSISSVDLSTTPGRIRVHYRRCAPARSTVKSLLLNVVLYPISAMRT